MVFKFKTRRRALRRAKTNLLRNLANKLIAQRKEKEFRDWDYPYVSKPYTRTEYDYRLVYKLLGRWTPMEEWPYYYSSRKENRVCKSKVERPKKQSFVYYWNGKEWWHAYETEREVLVPTRKYRWERNENWEHQWYKHNNFHYTKVHDRPWYDRDWHLRSVMAKQSRQYIWIADCEDFDDDLQYFNWDVEDPDYDEYIDYYGIDLPSLYDYTLDWDD